MTQMITRHSPVLFDSQPARTEMRSGWQVVLAYENEGAGPFLIDLSHISKWDIQNSDLSQIQPGGVIIPEAPGACVFEKGLLIHRMNRTQAVVWNISDQHLQVLDGSVCTDITEAYVLLGFLGADIYGIMEKITALDLQAPQKQRPFLLQGPILHVNCQLVVLENDALTIAFSRGYAQKMVEAILDAGRQWGMQPAGEMAFSSYLERVSH